MAALAVSKNAGTLVPSLFGPSRAIRHFAIYEFVQKNKEIYPSFIIPTVLLVSYSSFSNVVNFI